MLQHYICFGFNFLFLSFHNAVVSLWLDLGTKAPWLWLVKTSWLGLKHLLWSRQTQLEMARPSIYNIWFRQPQTWLEWSPAHTHTHIHSLLWSATVLSVQ